MTETAFKITQAQSGFLSTLMNKVSRSFAVVVPCLEEPLNHFMATTYLICRVAVSYTHLTLPTILLV